MSNPPVTSPTVPISVRDLAVWMERTRFALEQIGIGRVTMPREFMSSPADNFLLQGQEAVRLVASGLQAAGAPIPDRMNSTQDADLATLNELASPEIQARLQELIDALRSILPVAEALDKARGRWMPEAEAWGDTTAGTDTAESLHQMICGLELQLDAPKGRD